MQETFGTEDEKILQLQSELDYTKNDMDLQIKKFSRKQIERILNFGKTIQRKRIQNEK